MRKLTLEEIETKLFLLKPNIEILKIFTKENSKNKIQSKRYVLCRCKLDGYEWESSLGNLLGSPNGCPMCGGNAKLTLDEIKDRLHEINPNIEIVSNTYINSTTPLKCKCLINGCGHEWEATSDSLTKKIKPSGCPKCYGNIKLTLEDFKEKISLINPNIEVLSEFYRETGQTKKRIRRFIKCKCKIDGYEWDGELNSLLSGKGCLKCGNRMKLTLEEVKTRLFIISPNIEILSDTYINAHGYLKCKC